MLHFWFQINMAGKSVSISVSPSPISELMAIDKGWKSGSRVVRVGAWHWLHVMSVDISIVPLLRRLFPRLHPPPVAVSPRIYQYDATGMRRVDDVEKLRVQGEYIKQASAAQETREVRKSCPNCYTPHEVAFASYYKNQRLEERLAWAAEEERKRPAREAREKAEAKRKRDAEWEVRCSKNRYKADQYRVGGFYACNGCCKRLEDPLIESTCCAPKTEPWEEIGQSPEDIEKWEMPVWNPKWGETMTVTWAREGCEGENAVDLLYFKNEEDYQAWSKLPKQALKENYKERMSAHRLASRPGVWQCAKVILLIIAAGFLWYLMMVALKLVTDHLF